MHVFIVCGKPCRTHHDDRLGIHLIQGSDAYKSSRCRCLMVIILCICSGLYVSIFIYIHISYMYMRLYICVYRVSLSAISCSITLAFITIRNYCHGCFAMKFIYSLFAIFRLIAIFSMVGKMSREKITIYFGELGGLRKAPIHIISLIKIRNNQILENSLMGMEFVVKFLVHVYFVLYLQQMSTTDRIMLCFLCIFPGKNCSMFYENEKFDAQKKLVEAFELPLLSGIIKNKMIALYIFFRNLFQRIK